MRNRKPDRMPLRASSLLYLVQYDFVNIVEAPNNETMLKMPVELGSRGSAQLLTLAAIPVKDLIKKLK